MTDFVALFTGQGSQFAGMGKDLYDHSTKAREVLDRAEAALPGLRELCFEGPEEKLVLTENTQPCVLAVDVAAFVASGRVPAAAAGHSLGEYAALVAAGSLGLEHALPLVRTRARAMQEAVPAATGGMVVLRPVGLEEARVLAAAVESGPCNLANPNPPGPSRLSGYMAAIVGIARHPAPRPWTPPRRVPFHSSLLREAGEQFALELDQIEFEDPAFPIACNVDARLVTTGADARDALKRQFAGSVLWQQSMELLLDEGYRDFVEFGPKPTLSRMIVQIARAKDCEVTSGAVTTSADL